MGRIPSLQNDEARRHYRIYRLEQAKQIVGYSLLAIAVIGALAARVVYGGPPPKPLLIGLIVVGGMGALIHVSRQAFRDAQKIKLPMRRKYPPPPIESFNASPPPTNLDVAGYHVNLKPTPEEKRDA